MLDVLLCDGCCFRNVIIIDRSRETLQSVRLATYWLLFLLWYFSHVLPVPLASSLLPLSVGTVLAELSS